MNREMSVAEWRRALEALGAAEVLMRTGYAKDSISRSYYAVLHAAKSALSAKGLTEQELAPERGDG